ncbi:MAG: hypothetical protein U0X91_16825 [Spirosomataceae bacterium]
MENSMCSLPAEVRNWVRLEETVMWHLRYLRKNSFLIFENLTRIRVVLGVD